MATIIEFLIYQTLTGNLGATYYCQVPNDQSGEYVPLAEYEALQAILKRWVTISPKLDDFDIVEGQSLELQQLIEDTKGVTQ